MNNKKKKIDITDIVIIVAVIILIFNVCSLIINFLINNFKTASYNNYHTISKYVNENYKTLQKIANEYIKGNEVKNPKHVESISVHNSNDPYIENDNTIVEFNTDGKGLVPSTIYYGFYYSKNNIPAAFNNDDYKLVQYKTNSWKWTGTGDNEGKTIKIRDNWFYFEAAF